MMRALLSSLAVLAICVGLTAAADKNADKNANKNGQKATITKVDSNNHAVTVKMKDKDGKEVERTFKLTEEVRYIDSTGKVVAADVFKSGDAVLVIEVEGRLKELHQAKKGAGDSDKK